VLFFVLAAAAVAIAEPFAGKAAPSGGVSDNGAPTALQRVERRSLVSQTQVSGTLGYAGSRTVVVPAGTAPSQVQQAEQAVSSARSALRAAQASVSADSQALAQAEAMLRADKAQKRSSCAGSGSTSPACATAKQVVTADAGALAQARQKLTTDGIQVASARATLAAAEQSLSKAKASETSYDTSASYTMLPGAGKVVGRGEKLYAIDGDPTLLLYGSTPAWRAFAPGMSPGLDVAELNANLRALGYGDLSGDLFTSATAQAIVSLQQAQGLAATGTLLLGSVAFEPGAVRVKAVVPTAGQAVQPGPLMTVSSTREDVVVALDVAQQSEVKAGDHVDVTLPDNSTTPGVVTSVGKVATAPPSDQSAGGGSSNPTIDVDVRLLHAAAAGHLDLAPVEVSITTQSVNDALVVPVDALVALAGGGYAVEQVNANGMHRLVAVTPGLFDDTQGLVQATATNLAVGDRIVVPASP
jgi:peptidoglycan hydrolase-like protein with peptidoglycan-binding domain